MNEVEKFPFNFYLLIIYQIQQISNIANNYTFLLPTYKNLNTKYKHKPKENSVIGLNVDIDFN